MRRMDRFFNWIHLIFLPAGLPPMDVADPTLKTMGGGVGGGMGISHELTIGIFEASALLTISYIHGLASDMHPAHF